MHPLLPHLIEFRQRAIKSLVLIFLLFVPLFFFATPLFSFFAKPLLAHLNAPMVAIDVASPLLVPIQLAAKSAFILAMPYVLFQLWQFIAPALYQQERRFLSMLMLASVGLFYCGMAFCFFLVLPLIFHFFVSTVPVGIQFSPDISRYMDFVSGLLLAFGLCFQVPIATVLAHRSGLISLEQLRLARPYVIVSAFIIGMLLTPPDVLSQVLLALPVCALFELGLMVITHTTTASDNNDLAAKT